MSRTIKLSVYGPAKGGPDDLLRQKPVYKKDEMREYRRICREFSNLIFGNNTIKRRRMSYGSRSALSCQQLCVVKCGSVTPLIWLEG
jgi:hypothetical protein